MDNNYGFPNRGNMNRGGRGGMNRGGPGRGYNRGFRRGNFQNFRGPSGHSRGGNPNRFGTSRRYDDNKNASQQWQKNPKRDTPGKRLSEDAIGVTEYVSNHKGFNGIIKSRYSDFQVSEINEQGVLAQLTDMKAPVPPADKEVVDDEELLFSKYNVEILPMETWDRINKIAMSADSSIEAVQVDATNMSKEQRTKIHDAVKKAFGDSIVSSTVNIEDKKFLKFDQYRKGVRVDTRVKWMWPAEYVYFIVHKENCDTMDAASRIADRLRLNIKPSMLGYAGTKDRRAKTSQWLSLRKVDPRKIVAACKDMRDIKVGNFEFRDKNLKLGMLKGNQFRIALRNVTASDEVVSKACEELKEKGFLNYYGLQRFGSRIETPTYDIGLKLLQGKFQEAIDGILQEREGPMAHALRVYRHSGAGAALKVWPNRAFHSALEARLLRALAVNPNDLLGALNKMARNTRLLYLHSYQSLVWNRCVSERVRRLGLAPAVGDLIPADTCVHDEIFKLEGEDDGSDDEDTDSESTDGETAENKVLLQNLPVLETSIKESKKSIPVKILTQEDVDSGKYSIFDVIMPLPGHMVEYPPNMKEYYQELLEKDGLTLELKHKFRNYSMTGAYRHVAVRPVGVTWRTERYSQPYSDLLLSDLERMQGATRAPGLQDDGKYKALILTMTLPASCYATMALRELLKVDTSSDNQASQNNYHKQSETEDDKKQDEGKEEDDAKKQDEGKEEDDAKKQDEGKGEYNAKADVKSEPSAEEQNTKGEKRKADSESDLEAKKVKQEGA